MAMTEAQRRANVKWDKAHNGVLSVKLSKDTISSIRSYISNNGDTLAGFIRRACFEQMKRDAQTCGDEASRADMPDGDA